MKKLESEEPDFKSLYLDIYHPNPNINQKASQKLAFCWPDESIPLLLANLQSNDINVRRKSVKALGFFGKRVFAPLIEIFMINENTVIRTSCLKVFVQLAVNIGEEFPEEAMEV